MLCTYYKKIITYATTVKEVNLDPGVVNVFDSLGSQRLIATLSLFLFFSNLMFFFPLKLITIIILPKQHNKSQIILYFLINQLQ